MEPSKLQIALLPAGRKVELAAWCGVTPATITYWVKRGGVTGKHARKAAEFLGLPLEQILEKEAQ